MFGDQKNDHHHPKSWVEQEEHQEAHRHTVAPPPVRTPADRLGIAIDKIDGVIERLQRLDADLRGDDSPEAAVTGRNDVRPSICLQYVLSDGPRVIEEKLEIAHHALDKLCEMLMVDTSN